MNNYIAIASEPLKPIDPSQFKDSEWGQVIFFTVVGPIVLLCANEIWGLIKNRGKRVDKKQDSQLKSFEVLFAELQKNHNVLLQEIIGKNDEALKNIQATLTTAVGVMATVAENQKAYAEIAMRRSEETRLILDEIRKASTHTVIESMNSHVRINQMSMTNQQKIISILEETRKSQARLHERMDRHFGSDRVD